MPRPRSGGNAIYVAAANCPARLKVGADYVCDGVADDVEIQAAIDGLTRGYGGLVQLSPGLFTTAAPIHLRQGVKVHGSGMQATSLQAALDHPFDMFRWNLTPKLPLTQASGGDATTVTFAGDLRSSITSGDTIRISRGTGYGQKRTVSAVAFASGTTTVTVSAAWNDNPDSSSVLTIDAGSELFAGLAHFTASGRRKTSAFTAGNVGIYGYSAGAMTDAMLIDSVAASDVFPDWVEQCSVYIWAGTGKGQLRRIVGRSATGSYYDTLLLDGPWWTPLDATSRYAVVGSGFAQYGPNCLDFMLQNLWFTQFTGHGVVTEYGWGWIAHDFISEFNDLSGWYLSQAPGLVAVSSGAWGSSTTGHVVCSGPKVSASKIVANGGEYGYGGDGVTVYGRVVDGEFICSELGSVSGSGAGIALLGGYGAGPSYWAIVGNNFCSWGNDDAKSPILSAGVYLGGQAVYNTIVGNKCRASNASGPRAFIMCPVSGGQRNIIANNVVGLGSECFLVHNGSTGGGGVLAQNYDGSGFNLYQGNVSTTTREQDHFAGLVSGTANASGEVTLALTNTVMRAPAATDPVAVVSAADAATGAVAGWYVASINLSSTDPKNIQSVTVKSPSATSGTTYTFHLILRHECRGTGNS